MRKSTIMLVFVVLSFVSITTAQDPLVELPVVFQAETENTIIDVDWNFNSTLLAFADSDDVVSIIDVMDGTMDVQLDSVADEIAVIHAIGWSPTQNHLLIANNLTKIWNHSENEWMNDFDFPTAVDFVEYTPGNFDWHPEGNQFAIILRECDEGTPDRPGARIEVWDITTSTFTEVGECISRGFGEVKWNSQGTELAIDGVSIFDEEGFVESEEIRIWHIDTSEQLFTITDLQDSSGLAWNPMGDKIAFTSEVELDRNVQVWDIINEELIWETDANLGIFAPLEWHPSEDLIVTGGQDGSVRIWDALNGTELIELPVHEGIVNDVSWSPDGSMLASVGRDGRLYVWDVSEMRQLD